jgi:hypothetical protein
VKPASHAVKKDAGQIRGVGEELGSFESRVAIWPSDNKASKQEEKEKESEEKRTTPLGEKKRVGCRLSGRRGGLDGVDVAQGVAIRRVARSMHAHGKREIEEATSRRETREI